jgi:pyridine nucleotide-disulfide oxidoreductase family protein
MQKLVLVGGGHAHLHVLNQLRENQIKGVEITLLSPSKYQYYSGMFSGYTEGFYTEDQMKVDLEQLAAEAGSAWLQGAVTSVDPVRKTLRTEQGESFAFDVVSFDVGSMMAGMKTPGAETYALPIKPNFRFVEAVEEARRAQRVLVVGGGAAGIEISASLHAWRQKHEMHGVVTLVSAGPLLEQKKQRITSKMEHLLQQKGMDVRTNETITRIDKNSVITSTDQSIGFDALIWLTGPEAPDLFKHSDLPVDEKGYLLVENTLQVGEFPFIFGAGDCITLINHPDIDKAGVYAVKQGPVLYENLKAFFENGKKETFVPQNKYLSILSIGNGEGFLLYGNLSLHGKIAWHIKKRIDTNFVKQYQA